MTRLRPKKHSDVRMAKQSLDGMCPTTKACSVFSTKVLFSPLAFVFLSLSFYSVCFFLCTEDLLNPIVWVVDPLLMSDLSVQ